MLINFPSAPEPFDTLITIIGFVGCQHKASPPHHRPVQPSLSADHVLWACDHRASDVPAPSLARSRIARFGVQPSGVLETVAHTIALGVILWVLTYQLPNARRKDDPFAVICSVLTALVALAWLLIVGIGVLRLGEPFVVGDGQGGPCLTSSEPSVTGGFGVRWTAAARHSQSRSSAEPPGTVCYEKRMSPFSLAISLLGLSASLGFGVQQPTPHQPTLIELARKYGGVVGGSIACGGPRPSFEKVVADAAAIVHGTVISAEGRLSADEREVWTDYQVQPIQIIREGTSAPLSLPILFTARGGTVVVEGLTISHSYQQNDAKLTLQVGDEVVLLGTLHDKQLILNPISAFRVRDGEVRSNGELPGFSAEGQRIMLDDFVRRVRELQPGR